MMRMHSKRMIAQQRATRVARVQAAYAYERFARDGLLFYLKEAHYVLGSSPLSLAWKARSIAYDMGSLASGAASHTAWHLHAVRRGLLESTARYSTFLAPWPRRAIRHCRMDALRST